MSRSTPARARALLSLAPSRDFSTSSSINFPPKNTPAPNAAIQRARASQSREKPVDRMKDLRPNDFGDTSFMGYLRMKAIKEAQDLVAKVTDNHAILRGQCDMMVYHMDNSLIQSIFIQLKQHLSFPQHRQYG
jgi:hypothetical protein